MICVNMPLGPGSPRSPFSEYASVSESRKRVWNSHIQISTLSLTWLDSSVCYISVPLTASERSSDLTRCWMVLCRAAGSCPGPLPATPRLIPLSEWVRVDPAELLSMYDESSGSMMLMPEEADRRLVLAEAVPVMVSRASTRFLRRFSSSPVRPDRTWWTHALYIIITEGKWHAAKDAVVFYCLTQSDEPKEEAEEEEQCEQEAEQPLPPGAAGAEAQTRFILMDLWGTKKFVLFYFYFWNSIFTRLYWYFYLCKKSKYNNTDRTETFI